MLQLLGHSDAGFAMHPVNGGALTAAAGPLTWLDAEDPTTAELDQIAGAFDWSPAVRDAVDTSGDRQRAVRVGEWGILTLREPVGDGVGVLAINGTVAVTLRYAWPVDLKDMLTELSSWTALDEAGAMAVGCTLLSGLVDYYDDQSGAIEDRLVKQEAVLLDGSVGGDPLPALRADAALRSEVGDLRRRSNRLREVVGAIVRQELIDRRHGQTVDLQLRDIYDHLIRVHDDLDSYGERLIALQDSRLSLVAYRQNDITKKISGWGAVLLIPTITTGWYGQNFKHLLWLEQPAGPWFSAGVAVVLMIIATLLLKKADWL